MNFIYKILDRIDDCRHSNELSGDDDINILIHIITNSIFNSIKQNS